MNKYDDLFKKEQEKIVIKEQLVQNENTAKADVIINYCNEGLFEFLEYLQNKFTTKSHGINHHFDRAIYEKDMVGSFTNKEKATEYIKKNLLFRVEIQYKWGSGGELRVDCVDYKPVLKYEGVKMNLDTFIETVVSQIQGSIAKGYDSFVIITKD